MARKGENKKLKRIAAPRSWKIERKKGKWVAKARPGPYSIQDGIPLVVLIRDILKLANNAREARFVIKQGKLKVDGKVVKDPKFPVGFMSTISIPAVNKYYRIVYDKLGRLSTVEIPKNEANLKPVKVEKKTITKAGKIQITMHDGRNMLTNDKEIKTGDVILMKVPEQEKRKVIKLEEGNLAYVTKGSMVGEFGKIVGFIEGTTTRPPLVQLRKEDTDFLTKKDYVFVVGKERPEITMGGTDGGNSN